MVYVERCWWRAVDDYFWMLVTSFGSKMSMVKLVIHFSILNQHNSSPHICHHHLWGTFWWSPLVRVRVRSPKKCCVRVRSRVRVPSSLIGIDLTLIYSIQCLQVRRDAWRTTAKSHMNHMIWYMWHILCGNRSEPLITTCLFGANSYLFTLEWRKSLCWDLKFWSFISYTV